MMLKRILLASFVIFAFISVSLSSTPSWAADAQGTFEDALKLLEDKDILNDQDAIEIFVARGPSSIDFIEPKFVAAGRDMKAAFVEALGRIGDKRAFPVLMDELKRIAYVRKDAETFADSYIRIMIVKALGDLGDSQAVDTLRTITGSQDIYERTHAWVALDKLGQTDALSECESIARGNDVNCRNIVIIDAGRIGNNRAIPMLTAALKDETWFVRASAIDSLAKIGETSVKPEIEAMVKDRSPYVRQAAQDALDKFEKRATK